MMEIVPRLEKRTHYIATFANVITLVGLLGTIIGLIKGFTAVSQVNPAEKAELLSASISIAMNNTAFALTVAIPFLLIHAFLQARTAEIVDGLEAAKISFLNVTQRLKAEAGAVTASALNPPDDEDPAMRSSRIRRHAAELDVTAFINLIVVLVPFLLSTAVFTRLSVIDLSLPAKSSGAVEQLKVNDLKLEIVLRPDALEVGDRIGGLIQRIPNAQRRLRPGHAVAADAADQGQVPGHGHGHPAGTAGNVLRHADPADGRGARGTCRAERARPSRCRCSPTSRSATRRSPPRPEGQRDHEADPTGKARRAQGRATRPAWT